VLLETPDMMELQARQPDEAATRAVQESFRWPMDKWWQVGGPCFLQPCAPPRGAATWLPCCRCCNAVILAAPGQDRPGCRCGGTK
jgi:hypothetical protein